MSALSHACAWCGVIWLGNATSAASCAVAVVPVVADGYELLPISLKAHPPLLEGELLVEQLVLPDVVVLVPHADRAR